MNVSLVLGGILLAATVSALSGAESASKVTSGVIDWGSRPAKATGVGSRRDVCDAPTATLERLESHVSVLNPGAMSHPPHRHPQEELIFIREGTVDVSINGRTQAAGPGSILFFASNDLHNLVNHGTQPACYVVFQFTTKATLSPAGAKPANPRRLASAVFDWNGTAVKPTKTGARRDFLDSATATFAQLECHATTLNPGEIPHPPHEHADEEIVLVKEGHVQVEIGGAVHDAGPESLAFFSSHDRHGLKNTGTAPATYYVVRWKTGTEETKD